MDLNVLSKMCLHKIQSSSGLELSLKQVPKMLSQLTSTWAPDSFVVSFKLETDQNLVVSKAKGAIIKNNVNLVVANQLEVRRSHYMFVCILCRISMVYET